MPYVGGRLLGAPMDLHICFFKEFVNIVPFLSRWHWQWRDFSKSSHRSAKILTQLFPILCIFLSVPLPLNILSVGHGFLMWHKQIGMVFILLLFAVVVPCTLSDIVVPLFFAKDKDRQRP